MRNAILVLVLFFVACHKIKGENNTIIGAWRLTSDNQQQIIIKADSISMVQFMGQPFTFYSYSKHGDSLYVSATNVTLIPEVYSDGDSLKLYNTYGGGNSWYFYRLSQ